MRRLLSILALTVGLVLVGLGLAKGETPPSPAPLTAPVTAPAAPSPVLGAVDVATPGATPRRPTHLRLWHFDAPVVGLGLTGSELVPPSDPQVLGWWGRPAGAKQGTTLLAGHTVHTGGGTFDDLEDVPVGTVGSLSGVRYEVVSVEVISKAALAERAQSLFDQSGEPRLVLVTCEDYDVNTGHYDSNVVVIAKPEGRP